MLKRFLIALLLGNLSSLVVAGQLESAPVQARIAHLNAKLTPQARAWLQQEARREVATNSISEVSAVKAVRAASVDLSAIPVEDAVLIVMSLISEDARKEMKENLADMKASNEKKKALRDAQQENKSQQNSSATIKLRANIAQTIATQSNSQGNNELQQLPMQSPMDRMEKAESAASNVMKKMSDTQSSLIGNMK